MTPSGTVAIAVLAAAGLTIPGGCRTPAPAAPDAASSAAAPDAAVPGAAAPDAGTPPAAAPPGVALAPDPSGGAGVSVTSFGALCDGVADDSDALQAGLDAAAAQGFALLIPVGLCNFSKTLSLNDGPRGVAIRGERSQGAQASSLRYTGSGTALVAQNGTSGSFVYNLVFQDFGIEAAQAAQLGFDARFVSEARFRNFSILGGAGRFALAWRCTGCNIVYLDGLTLSGNGAGIDLVDPAAVFISHGDFFAHATYVLKLEGTVTHVVVRDSWFEQQDFGLLFDSTDVSLVEVTGNRFLFNGGPAFANQVAAQFDDSRGGPITVRGFHFSGNSGYCAPGLCSAPSFIRMNLPDSASASSVTLWVEHNVLLGTATDIIGGSAPGQILRARLFDNDVADAPRR